MAVRTAMGCQIGALPCTPFPASRDFPSRGNEKYGGERQRVIYFTYHFGVFPLWWLAPPPFPPQAGALWMLSYGVMSLQESIERPILPPEQGEVRRSRIGGGERSEPIRRILIMPYDTESKSRNADFISIARRAIHHPQRRRRCRPLSEANTTRRRQAATTLGA